MTQSTPSQHWQAQQYEDNAGFVSAYGTAVLDWLHAQAGEHILDLGCGDGTLMARIAQSGATVAGVDGSRDMVVAAQARGFQASCADAHALTFHQEFDAVFSNAALHWMTNPQAVLQGVAHALKPHGRFVAEMGADGNIATIRRTLTAVAARMGLTLRTVWFFPSEAEYRALLNEAGFIVDQITVFARPTPLPTGIEGWLATFAAPLLVDLNAEQRRQILADTVAELHGCLPQQNGRQIADYVRLRFAAHLA